MQPFSKLGKRLLVSIEEEGRKSRKQRATFVCDEYKKYEAMITDLKKENEVFRKENIELKAKKSLTNFSYDNISLKEQLFTSLTGLPKTSCDTLWDFADPGEHCERLMFYDPSRHGDDVSPGRSVENKRRRKLKMLPADQLFIFLVWFFNF